MTAASDLAKQRKRTPKECSACGATVPMLAVQTYCSDACRQRADYKRNKEPATTPSRR